MCKRQLFVEMPKSRSRSGRSSGSDSSRGNKKSRKERDRESRDYRDKRHKERRSREREEEGRNGDPDIEECRRMFQELLKRQTSLENGQALLQESVVAGLSNLEGRCINLENHHVATSKTLEEHAGRIQALEKGAEGPRANQARMSESSSSKDGNTPVSNFNRAAIPNQIKVTGEKERFTKAALKDLVGKLCQNFSIPPEIVEIEGPKTSRWYNVSFDSLGNTGDKFASRFLAKQQDESGEWKKVYVDGIPNGDESPQPVLLHFNPDKSPKQERLEMLGRKAKVALAPFFVGKVLFLRKSEAIISIDHKPAAVCSCESSLDAKLGFFPESGLSEETQKKARAAFLSSIANSSREGVSWS